MSRLFDFRPLPLRFFAVINLMCGVAFSTLAYFDSANSMFGFICAATLATCTGLAMLRFAQFSAFLQDSLACSEIATSADHSPETMRQSVTRILPQIVTLNDENTVGNLAKTYFENSNDIGLIFSATGHVLAANNAAKRTLETNAEPLLGRQISALVTPLGTVDLQDNARMPETIVLNGDPYRVTVTCSDPSTPASGYAVTLRCVTAQVQQVSLEAALNKNELTARFDAEGVVKTASNILITLLKKVGIIEPTKFDDMFGTDPKSAKVWNEKPTLAKLTLGPATKDQTTLIIALIPIPARGSDEPEYQLVAHIVSSSADTVTAEKPKREPETFDAELAEIADTLVKFSSGDLTALPGQSGNPRLAKIQDAFRGLGEDLSWTACEMQRITQQIKTGCGLLAESQDSHTKQTQKRTATIEQTIGAISQLNDSVEQAVKGSVTAKDYVSRVRQSAEESGQVVQNAIAAMGEIEVSSNQISQIIGVIEDIAFQTNLLALNAGVEAARAGESGRGFAVVATEVRALAQRSSDAAKQIKGLISESTAHVSGGVKLVNRAGDALTQITGEVASIDEQVIGIAATSSQQSKGLAAINVSIAELESIANHNTKAAETSKSALETVTNGVQALSEILMRIDQSSGANSSLISLATAKPAPINGLRTSKNGRTHPGKTPNPVAVSLTQQTTDISMTECPINDQSSAKIAQTAVVSPRTEPLAIHEIEGSWEDF